MSQKTCSCNCSVNVVLQSIDWTQMQQMQMITSILFGKHREALDHKRTKYFPWNLSVNKTNAAERKVNSYEAILFSFRVMSFHFGWNGTAVYCPVSYFQSTWLDSLIKNYKIITNVMYNDWLQPRWQIFITGMTKW